MRHGQLRTQRRDNAWHSDLRWKLSNKVGHSNDWSPYPPQPTPAQKWGFYEAFKEASFPWGLPWEDQVFFNRVGVQSKHKGLVIWFSHRKWCLVFCRNAFFVAGEGLLWLEACWLPWIRQLRTSINHVNPWDFRESILKEGARSVIDVWCLSCICVYIYI